MVPDKKLYSVLISAVGSADPQAVLTMQDHLLKENVVGSEVRLASPVPFYTVFVVSEPAVLLMPQNCFREHADFALTSVKN